MTFSTPPLTRDDLLLPGLRFHQNTVFPMTLSVAEPWLSASISAPAAWAAFAAVQNLPWSLRVTTWEPLKFDVSHSYDFQTCLDQAGSFAFDNRARGEIALRILAIAEDFDERQLKVRHLSPDMLRVSPTAEEKALGDLKAAIISRIRHELTYRFDGRPQSWADRVKTELSRLPVGVGAGVSSYLGMDQELTDPQSIAGLKYVFSTLEPVLKREGRNVSLDGHPRKLKDVRAARHDPDPKARARNLALRSLESRLALLSAQDAFDDILLDLAFDDLLQIVRDELLEVVRQDGCWGLVDLSIRQERQSERLALAGVLPEGVWDLVREQERRIDIREAQMKS